MSTNFSELRFHINSLRNGEEMVSVSVCDLFKTIHYFRFSGSDTSDSFITPKNIIRLDSISEISNKKSRSLWENAITESSNELSVYLDLYHQEKFNSNWNVLGREYSQFFDEYIKDDYLNLYNNLGVKKEIMFHDDRESVILCMMYFHFKEDINTADESKEIYNQFEEELFFLLKIGLYPCGWAGGIYPRGNFIAY